jgi:hypothetical protein
MTRRASATPRMAALSADAEMIDEALAMRQRYTFRAGFWRVALGVIGLFWVCVLLALLG